MRFVAMGLRVDGNAFLTKVAKINVKSARRCEILAVLGINALTRAPWPPDNRPESFMSSPEARVAASTSETAATPGLRRVLSLWDLILYGIVLVMPIAPVPLFGIAQ